MLTCSPQTPTVTNTTVGTTPVSLRQNKHSFIHISGLKAPERPPKLGRSCSQPDQIMACDIPNLHDIPQNIEPRKIPTSFGPTENRRRTKKTPPRAQLHATLLQNMQKARNEPNAKPEDT